MIEEPSRYEQRIGDYMETINLSPAERKAVWGKLGCHKSLLGRTIKDIFIGDGAPGADQEDRRVLWAFTSDVASQFGGGGSQLSIDFISHRDVRYVGLVAGESDFFSVGPKSSLTMSLRNAGGHTASLTAHGVNCLQLLTMFRKYFSRRLAP